VTDSRQSTIICRSDRVDETRIGDRLVLYQRDTGAGIVLNPAGSLIWDTLSKPRSTDQIVDVLAQRYDRVARERVSNDVATYINSLRNHSLLDEAG
jgi:hypothetical protein